MSENLQAAACTVQEFNLARAAGLLIVTTADERAVHRFAEAIRAEERAVKEELLKALRITRALLVDLEDYSPEGHSVKAIDAAIAKADGAGKSMAQKGHHEHR